MKLNNLEIFIVDSLNKELDASCREIINDQIKRFTKVQRDPYGKETLFYWKKFFNRIVPQVNYPLKFKVLEDGIEKGDATL